MGLVRRLDALDRRIVTSQDGKFDAPQPWWVRYAFVATLPLTLLGGFARTNVTAWWVAYSLSAAVLLATIFFVLRWTRAHRRRTEQFEIEVDRHL